MTLVLRVGTSVGTCLGVSLPRVLSVAFPLRLLKSGGGARGPALHVASGAEIENGALRGTSDEDTLGLVPWRGCRQETECCGAWPF